LPAIAQIAGRGSALPSILGV